METFMKKEKRPAEYYRLRRTDRNMFTVETIIVENDKIVKTYSDDPSYLPIAFDKLRRRTAEAFFTAVEEENQA
jgi:hypothetical protein